MDAVDVTRSPAPVDAASRRSVVAGAVDGFGGLVARSLDAEPVELTGPMPEKIAGAVIVLGADPFPRPATITELSDAEWFDVAEGMVRTALVALQNARGALLPVGGPIVVLEPTIGIAGSATLVAYTTAVEGIRSMVKSAARQWASDNVTVNSVAVALEVLAAGRGAQTTHITPAVLSDTTSVTHSIVSAVRFLLGQDASGLTGTTIVADGGAVMAP